MTVHRGVLLFDYPETAIGKWENEIGHRGMKEVWCIPGTDLKIAIDMDESADPDGESEECWEVSVENGDGDQTWIAFGTFAHCDGAAKRFMAVCPDGTDLMGAAKHFFEQEQQSQSSG